MSKKEKLIKRLKAQPKDFTFDEAETLLGCFGRRRPDMKNTMEYKGYVGSVEFSEKDNVFFGKVMGIRALISYEGTNGKELVEDFHNAVDEYLLLCETEGVSPEVAYKGSFNVRISPELHKQAVIAAQAQQISLNSFVENSIRKSIK